MKGKSLAINAAWCKGCNICVAFCPRQVLALDNGKVVAANAGQCVKCGQCEQRCPDYAIYIVSEEDTGQ